MKKAVRSFTCCVSCLLLLSIFSQQAFGEKPGALKMNNQVIYSTTQQDKTAVTFVIPDLFLPKKTAASEELDKRREAAVVTAQKSIFIKETKKPEDTLGKKVTPYLFKKEALAAPSAEKESRLADTAQLNKLAIYAGLAAGGAALSLLGIFLGNRFSYLRDHKTTKE